MARAASHSAVTALLVCGTLDIGWAIGQTLLSGGDPLRMLRGVAAGPFGKPATEWGVAGSLAGLAVHFAIMAVMVAVYATSVRLRVFRKAPWWLLGIGYGAVLYFVMYRIVLPLRWPATHPLHDPRDIALTLLPHLVCVGLPLAWLFRRSS